MVDDRSIGGNALGLIEAVTADDVVGEGRRRLIALGMAHLAIKEEGVDDESGREKRRGRCKG